MLDTFIFIRSSPHRLVFYFISTFMNIFPYALWFLLLSAAIIIGGASYIDGKVSDLNYRIDLSFQAIDRTNNYVRTEDERQSNRIDSAFNLIDNVENGLQHLYKKKNCNMFVPKIWQIVWRDIIDDAASYEWREQFWTVRPAQDKTILEMEVHSFLVEDWCLMHINQLWSDWHPID